MTKKTVTAFVKKSKNAQVTSNGAIQVVNVSVRQELRKIVHLEKFLIEIFVNVFAKKMSVVIQDISLTKKLVNVLARNENCVNKASFSMNLLANVFQTTCHHVKLVLSTILSPVTAFVNPSMNVKIFKFLMNKFVNAFVQSTKSVVVGKN
jgi:hypothetical protein